MLDNIIKKCETKLKDLFEKIDEISLYNQEKVLKAFQNNQIALRHFSGTSGYGYGDEGRDAINRLLADVFKAEKAILSPSIVSGTHALSLCLYAILRTGDTLLSVSGTPYDTLKEVIYGKDNGSLEEFGVKFKSIDLLSGDFDYEKINNFLKTSTPKMIYVQRSRGYEWREAISIEKLEKLVKFLRNNGFNGCIMVDNCYGEFVDKREPIELGVNILAGSMIKNVGGGIAPTGGYIVGDEKYIDMVLNRLTAPSIAGEVGSYAYGYQYYFQGIFLAPHVTAQALKGSLLFGAVLKELGYETSPSENVMPCDIIRAIKFNDKNALISFIQTIQENSPIDSHVLALPWAMPGYEDEVIMAAGCFVQGSSIELSADAPIKPPYIAYLQGGITFEHCKIALKNVIYKLNTK